MTVPAQVQKLGWIMEFSETIRLSEKAKQQLIKVKRATGIDRWNVLCRWAFCLSLSEQHKPQDSDIKLDSNIEIDWRTFTGAGHENIYYALLKYRCAQDGLPLNNYTLTKYLRLHMHRGIAYLANPGRLGKLEDFQEIIRQAASSDC